MAEIVNISEMSVPMKAELGNSLASSCKYFWIRECYGKISFFWLWRTYAWPYSRTAAIEYLLALTFIIGGENIHDPTMENGSPDMEHPDAAFQVAGYWCSIITEKASISKLF